MKIVFILVLILVLLSTESLQAQVPRFTWVDRIGSNEGEHFYGGCTDSFGNVYVYGGIGSFIDSLGIDTVYRGQNIYFSDKNHSDFIASYDPQGNLRWMNFFGGSYRSGGSGRLICSDASGNIYCALRGDDTLYILDTVIYSNYSSSILVKLDTSGALVSAKEIRGSVAELNAISCDNDGNVYVCGYFYGETYFDQNKVFTASSNDAFIAKYSNDFTLIWINITPSTHYAIWNDFSFSADGTINLVGDFGGIILIGDEFIESVSSADILIGRVFPDGTGGVLGAIGGKGIDRSKFSATDEEGNSYIIGSIFDTVDIGGVILVADDLDSSAILSSYFFASYSKDGDLRWVKTVHPEEGKNIFENSCFFESAYVYPNGESILLGSFLGSVVFDSIGNSINIERDTVQSFLLKLNKQGDYSWLKFFPRGGRLGGNEPILITSNLNDFYYTGTIYGFMQFDSIVMTALAPVKNTSYDSRIDIAVSKLVFPTSSVVDISQVENSRLSIFPNPAFNKATLYFDDVFSNKPSIEIYDVLGMSVTHLIKQVVNLDGNTVELWLDGLASGSYLVTLKTNSAVKSTILNIIL